MTVLEPYRDWFDQTNLSMPEKTARDKLAAYLSELQKWNKRMNLTADRDPIRMLERHLLDSLVMTSQVEQLGDAVLDIGSGGGFPAVPLAIVFPDIRFTLVERVARKCAFLRAVGRKYELGNMIVLESDLDRLTVAAAVPVAMTRAVRVDESFLEALKRIGVNRLLGFTSEPDSTVVKSYQLPGETGVRHLFLRHLI